MTSTGIYTCSYTREHIYTRDVGGELTVRDRFKWHYEKVQGVIRWFKIRIKYD